MLFEARRDLGVLAFEQAVAGEIALDQKWTEIFHFQYPDGLREPELFEPVDAGDTPDTAAEERAGAVADRGEIDGIVRHEEFAIDVRSHAALADDDVAAGEFEPAVEPLREAERRGRGHRADGVAAVRVDARRRRAVEIGDAERILSRRHAETVGDGALVDAFARSEQPAAQIRSEEHTSELQSPVHLVC